jgi:hypothetical protein
MVKLSLIIPLILPSPLNKDLLANKCITNSDKRLSSRLSSSSRSEAPEEDVQVFSVDGVYVMGSLGSVLDDKVVS